MNAARARYDEALRLAALVHAGQTWKGTPLPYITHVVRVASLLADANAPEPLVLAGLLHDTLEDLHDTPELRAGLSETFSSFDAMPGHEGLTRAVTSLIERIAGPTALALVEAVTASSRGEAGDATARRARRQRQLDHLRTAPDDVVRLKAADTWANVTEMTREIEGRGVDGARSGAPAEELRWYYGGVASIVRERLDAGDPLARQLAEAIDRLRDVSAAAS